jgi:hypothetical protein
MTLKQKLVIGAALLGVVLLLWGAWSYHQSALANARAEAVEKTNDATEKRIDAVAKARDKEFDAQIAEKNLQIAKLKALPPKEVVKLIPEYVAIREPIFIPAIETEIATSSGTINPGDAVIPEVSITPITVALAEGNKCKLELAKCSAQRSDWKEKYELQKDSKEEWKSAAKGGNWFRRHLGDVVKVGVAGGAGYVIGRISK